MQANTHCQGIVCTYMHADTVDAAQQSSLLITSEALAVTSRLIVGSPNINAGLLVPIQQLVSGLLDMEAKQRKDASGPGTHARFHMYTMVRVRVD